MKTLEQLNERDRVAERSINRHLKKVARKHGWWYMFTTCKRLKFAQWWFFVDEMEDIWPNMWAGASDRLDQ